VLIEGVMESKLQWDLIFFGMFLAGIVELFGVTSLAFAIGLYLPVGLSVGIIAGALIRYFLDRKRAVSEGEDSGILFSSGLIAGEALVGIGLALVATAGIAFDGWGGALGAAEVPVTLAIYGTLLLMLWRSARAA
jgi:uncharacterized oligopeptide transporter (OPT) family protein